MEFTHKKYYKDNKLHERYYINDKEVEKHIYESLDNDAFEEHMKNIKPKDKKGHIDLKQPCLPSLCSHIENPNEFHDAITDIVNYIKMSNISNGACKIIDVIDVISEEQYMIGYTDALINVKDDLNSCIIKLSKSRYGGRKDAQK